MAIVVVFVVSPFVVVELGVVGVHCVMYGYTEVMKELVWGCQSLLWR